VIRPRLRWQALKEHDHLLHVSSRLLIVLT
jgi:hypothetical protein